MDYRSVIESKYNRQNWQELLHDIFGQRVTFWGQPQQIIADKNIAKKALYTGNIELQDGHRIAVYEVELVDNVQIERNRVGIRNLLCGSWKGNGFSGAFMFCFRQNESVLRFSYVSESFAFAEDGSLTKESTDTKRFTYYLGEGHRSRTAIKQFEDLKKSTLDLKAITKAFSVEALSDMFFKEYKKQYENIIEYITGKRMVKMANKWEEQVTGQPCQNIMQEFAHFEDSEKAVRDYVKKLMGRLVFLQFLQKKGWMGCPVGDDWTNGDKEFVQNLFDNSLYKDTFVDNVLEPLFDDLNSKRNNDIVSSANVGINIKVPYLNGGLFEKDEYDQTAFPLPAKYMKDMLDFFASYNFTIDENDPDDAEIGVDPEMLGRIFENLLEDNKDKGAFYTPKEIVQYMCRESLIAYLTSCVIRKQGESHKPENKIQEAVRRLLNDPDSIVPKMSAENLLDFGTYIRDVKICDPAIGSGAFPMGLLNELVRCRVSIGAWAKDEYGKLLTDDYAALKTEIICNNIYGVDIEKGAIDIARLRFWLSIIVDEKAPHALPNFDYKFMQGNSLIPTFAGEYINLSTKKQQHINVQKMIEVKKKILDFKHRFFMSSGEDKQKLNVLIKDHILQLISLQLGYEIKAWADAHAEQLSFFSVASEITVRDAIKQLPEERRRVVELGKSLREQLADKNISLDHRSQIDIQFFDWRLMFTEVFENEGKGFDIVIGNPPYGANIDSLVELYKKLYNDAIKSYAEIYKIFIAFGFNILCDDGIICYITPNTYISQPRYKDLRSVMSKKNILEISNLGENVFEAVVPTAIFIAKNSNNFANYLYKDYSDESNFKGILQTSNSREILSENVLRDRNLNLAVSDAKNDDYTFEDIFDLKDAGIQYHRVNIGLKNKGGNDLYERLFSENPNDFSMVQPVWYGKLISKYYVSEVTDEFFNLEYKSILNSNEKVSFNLPSFNKSEKIIWRQTADRIIATIDFEKKWFRNTIQCAYLKEEWSTRINIKYALAIFNSSYIRYKYNEIVREAGRVFPQVKLTYLKQLPFCVCEKEKQQVLIDLVDKILLIKAKDQSVDTSSIENKIDRIVYELYGLTNHEVKKVNPDEIINGKDEELFKL